MAAHDYEAICLCSAGAPAAAFRPAGAQALRVDRGDGGAYRALRHPEARRALLDVPVDRAGALAGMDARRHARQRRGDSNCGGVMGLNAPGEKYLDGSMFHNVWFATVEAAREHQAQMPRVPAGKYVGVVAAPLAKGRLDPPDAVLVYATPGQMILHVNALQHRNYVRCDFTVTGETACADSWGRGLATGRAEHLDSLLRRAALRGRPGRRVAGRRCAWSICSRSSPAWPGCPSAASAIRSRRTACSATRRGVRGELRREDVVGHAR